jgi:hypothetical protein
VFEVELVLVLAAVFAVAWLARAELSASPSPGRVVAAEPVLGGVALFGRDYFELAHSEWAGSGSASAHPQHKFGTFPAYVVPVRSSNY